MKITIDNLAKINHAEIEMNGITVIAGENNTGKSTVGKTLFSIFDSLYNVDKKVLEQKAIYIVNEVKTLTYRNVGRLVIPEKFANRLLEAYRDSKELDEVFDWYFASFYFKDEMSEEDINSFKNEFIERIMAILNLPKERIIKEVVSNKFYSVFYKQVNSLIHSNKKTFISLNLQHEDIKMEFLNNKCSLLDKPIDIFHKAIYLDNPFIVDDFNMGMRPNTEMGYSFFQYFIENDGRNNMNNVIGGLLNKDKLRDVFAKLDTVVHGALETESDEFTFAEDNMDEPIIFNNLSTGLKAFVLLKLLLEKNILKERDVLILDEPEIHLHPEWQIIYAELIVLLQKYFDLTIVIATHSHYFIDAIDLYSIKHGVDDKVNFYLSSMNKNGVEMENVTENLEKIYEKMASPLNVLENLRYDLNK